MQASNFDNTDIIRFFAYSFQAIKIGKTYTIMDIALVAGTRPNFMKISPILRAMKTLPKLKRYFVHTGQHYNRKMSDVFF